MRRILVALLFLVTTVSTGCATVTEKYFEERVDKGALIEGQYEKTGIFFKFPGDPLTAMEVGLGRTVGWGVVWAMPQASADSTYYEHRSNVNADANAANATVSTETLLFSGALTEDLLEKAFASWGSMEGAWEEQDDTWEEIEEE